MTIKIFSSCHSSPNYYTTYYNQSIVTRIKSELLRPDKFGKL